MRFDSQLFLCIGSILELFQMFSQLYRCQKIIRNALNFSEQVRVIAMIQITSYIILETLNWNKVFIQLPYRAKVDSITKFKQQH